jgi:hypothetical protein
MKLTTAQIEEIESKLRTGKIVRVEPMNWPETREETQKTLAHYKQAEESLKTHGSEDILPGAYLSAIQKLEEMLKNAK